jgi:hypothetical protein
MKTNDFFLQESFAIFSTLFQSEITYILFIASVKIC